MLLEYMVHYNEIIIQVTSEHIGNSFIDIITKRDKKILQKLREVKIIAIVEVK